MKVFEIYENESPFPKKITPAPVPAFPKMPQTDGEQADGSTVSTTQDGGKKLSGADGTFFWDKNGQPKKWHISLVDGLTQIHNARTGDITVYYAAGGAKVAVTYDKDGNYKSGESSYRYPGKDGDVYAKRVYEGVGRIVKGVNTTPDVGVNQTSIEAAKFGNSVDKDGRPPTLSSKVKGKSTNVLFNLGLTEGVMLKFQRGEDFDTLHIKPKGKNRVELRGKPGYERGNYDAQDKLHQVLDNLGKAANFAELMNGETVSINPNHPDGERANKTAQDILSTEGFGDWIKTALNSDPQFKAWHRMYKQDPQKAKRTFGRKHTEFLAQLQSESIEEKWSAKYKRSINCNNPKGFSQKAHCAGRKK